MSERTTITVTLRMPPELYEQIKALAAAEDRNINNFVCRELKRLVEEKTRPE